MEETQKLTEFGEDEQQRMVQFKMRKIKSKYIIAIILSYSDEREELAKFTHSCNKAFRSFLSSDNYRMFLSITNQKWFNSELRKSLLIRAEKQVNLLLEGLQCKRFRLELLMRGSRDGFKAATFHQLCDGQGPTLCVVQSESKCIFGGYTTVSWNGINDPSNDGFEDPYAFIFTFDHEYIHRPQPNRYAICLNSKTLCWFGRGFRDLCIDDDCDQNEKSRSDLGFNFYAAHNNRYLDERAKNWLAGSQNFKVVEIEVFKLQKLIPLESPDYAQKFEKCSDRNEEGQKAIRK
ncbi:hypothetical protein FGO68_gene12750 [Halteria grandinella]|uniref:TLDc domain-containing protein n=1 Tax=Halteria grandinella TaxID=5974 RepID=A0A8J8NM24_HALGN|nr:hypothetical protein FGO68_gene12750 [Halteria grandinella]